MPYVTLNEETERKWQGLLIMQLSQHLTYVGSNFAFTEGAASACNLDSNVFFKFLTHFRPF